MKITYMDLALYRALDSEFCLSLMFQAFPFFCWFLFICTVVCIKLTTMILFFFKVDIFVRINIQGFKLKYCWEDFVFSLCLVIKI